MAERPTIVATAAVDEQAIAPLAALGTLVVTPDFHEQTIIDSVADAVGVICRGEAHITSAVMDAAPKLVVIGRTGVGVDSVDVAAATERGIPVINTPGANARSVAEAALTFTLMLLKQVPYWDRQVKDGNWQSRYQLITRDIEGAVLGILGFGNIGKVLAGLAAPLGIEVLASDPYVDAAAARAAGAELVPFAELLERADVVSLHATLTDETRGIINAETLRLMKPGAALINLGRGGLVDGLDILHQALVEERLGGVALDAFEPEPPDVSHPLFRHERCTCSPHALGLTPGSLRRIFVSMAQDMAAVLGGKRPRFCVNPETLGGLADGGSK